MKVEKRMSITILVCIFILMGTVYGMDQQTSAVEERVHSFTNNVQKEDTPLQVTKPDPNRKAIIEALQRGAQLNDKVGPYNTLSERIALSLQSAVSDKDENKIIESLGWGADINTKDRCGESPLIKAIYTGCTNIVQLLLAHKADSYVTTCLGESVLLKASWLGHEEIVKIFLEQKVNVNQPDSFNYTPLMRAAENNRTGVVKILLDHQAYVDVKEDNEGNTPLHYAAYNGHTEITTLLLDSKAPIDILNTLGQTALEIAIEHNHSEMVPLLQEKENYELMDETDDAEWLLIKNNSCLERSEQYWVVISDD